MKASWISRGVGLFIIILLVAAYCNKSQEEKSNDETSSTAFADPPQWAQEAIWYQIFVERFYNGDPTNDPTPANMEGAYPFVVPSDWQLTPWTHDWYAPDPYFATLDTMVDGNGNPFTHFAQKAQLRRYGGDLQGVMDKLDYLEELGITAIYFNPLNDAPSLHKYDARNWRHIDRNFGPDPEGDAAIIAREDPTDPKTWQWTAADQLFLDLLDSLHTRGIKVILDYSWNHTGTPFFAWKDLVAHQQQSQYADWYWIESWDDPATDSNEFDYRGWLGNKSLPEIKETAKQEHDGPLKPFEGDIYSQAAKDHIFAITRRWLDPNGDGDPSDGVDGYRLDVAAEVPLGFWREYREVVRDVNPDAYLLGELWWEDYPHKLLDPEPYLRRDIFDAPMNYRWYRAARVFFNASPGPISPSAFVDSLNSYRSNIREANNRAMMNLTASHDVPRVSTSLFNKNLYKYQASATNPEYKIHQPDAATYATLRMLLVQQFTYIGSPHIWAGDEMGMWGADDPSTRKPLIWPEYDFEPERVHPLGLDRPVDEVVFNDSLFTFYQSLIDMRKAYPVLNSSAIEFVLVDDEKDLLGYSRANEESEVLVVFNNGEESQMVTVPTQFGNGYHLIIGPTAFSVDQRQLTLTLPGRSAAVYARGGR